MKYFAIIFVLFLAGCSSAATMPGNAVTPANFVSLAANVEAPNPNAPCKSMNALPDPICSPGVARTQDTGIICSPEKPGDRPTKYQELAFKKQVMLEYGVPLTDFKKWILDHVIPISSGGDGFNIKNMFLQKIAVSKRKDRVEAFIRRQICTGAMTPASAQAAIATNWKAIKIK